MKAADLKLERKERSRLEEGMLGQCAGEKITMIVPPSLGNIEIHR